MLLKYFYDQTLAHASYLVGCQRSGVAVVVDPGRDIDVYLRMAEREGVNLVGALETHIHADYVSGARELAERTGAVLYVSDEGPAEWKYEYARGYRHHLLKNGDSFMIGNIRFEVMHTPGHTPESISFLLTDQGGHADKPMGIFTGDFVFVGSVGRPDLLEKAAGLEKTAEPGARDLYRSTQKFKQLPDYLQVWPAHGAGSACGKGLGAVPSSTVGYEKLFNEALQFTDEESFVRYILSDQPEAPNYFAEMKRINRVGPRILGDSGPLASLSVDGVASALETATVIDISMWKDFASGHVPRTVNIPAPMLGKWAGWLVNYSRPVYLIADGAQVQEAVRVLQKIGIDQIRGYFDVQKLRSAGLAQERYESGTPKQLEAGIQSGEVSLVDVRSDAEWQEERISKAQHRFLGTLPEALSGMIRDRPVVTMCQSGARSAVGASLLQAAGFKVINMAGGLDAWKKAGLPVER